MVEGPGLGVDLHRIPQVPYQQVHQVDALVHEDTAAVQGPGTTPGGLVVVFLRPVVGHGNGRQGQFSQVTGLDGLPDILEQGQGPALKGHP